MSINLIPKNARIFNIQKGINIISLISTIKEQKGAIISLVADKAFFTIQYAFIIKTYTKLRIHGKFCKLIKVIY